MFTSMDNCLSRNISHYSSHNWVVSAYTTDTCKTRLDKFCHSQDIVYDFRAQLQGTGSRSEVLCEKFE